MDRSMEVDLSIDNVPFNGINSDENDNDGNDEENGIHEILLGLSLFKIKIQYGYLIQTMSIMTIISDNCFL
jgi:hypothetical protein